MKLYAVVIGRKDRHTRYVAYEPFLDGNHRNGVLAVYDNVEQARRAQKELRSCGDKDIYVIRFVPARR